MECSPTVTHIENKSGGSKLPPYEHKTDDFSAKNIRLQL